MIQLEHIEAIEKRLWTAADTLRANSGYASNEYFLPIMGLVFLRHAYSRFLRVKDEIEATLPSRGGKVRALTKEDFSQKGAIFLRPEAQFDYLVSLPDKENRGKAIIAAMESIEADYSALKGQLPKADYQKLSNEVLGKLLRDLNPEELKKVSGDVFGRIYEYFLTQFADQKAHDGGEFFTPISIVSVIAHVLEPIRGTVLDPACGSGGMFVQSARIVEEQGQIATERLTFRGLEKNPTTIRLANMNLAVHGLEGDIQEAITYYEDPHGLVGQADYVMANPPFNVDEIDAEKVEGDPRLPFGLPGVNKKKKVSNGNYVWISYFHSYLNERGRAGFVMSSQSSSAGRGEAEVRKRLIETGDVDIMIAIRSNFFYTRTVPCELWFFDRAKPEHLKDKVLMLDARNVYRQVTRKIYDFSPEQQENLLAVVWLYRGQKKRFLDLVSRYLARTLKEAEDCFGVPAASPGVDSENPRPILDFVAAMNGLRAQMEPFLKTLSADGAHREASTELDAARQRFKDQVESLQSLLTDGHALFSETEPWSPLELNRLTAELRPLADAARALVKQVDLQHKLMSRLVDLCEGEHEAKKHKSWKTNKVRAARKDASAARELLASQLKQVDYFHRQARWLTERFPEAELRDVEGLVKLVDRAEIEENDWSLTPGRYVGVAPEEEDPDFDFGEALKAIHGELDILNDHASQLSSVLRSNYMGLILED